MRRRGLPRRGPGVADPRRHGLRRGVPRRAVLPRGPADEDRAHQPGDDPELPGVAYLETAEELLMTHRLFGMVR